MDLLFAETSTGGWGTEQHCAALAIAMARRGHRVRCLITAGSPLEAQLRDAGLPLIQVPADKKNREHGRLAMLRDILRVPGPRPDWLITNNPRHYWSLALAARLTGSRAALFRHWDRIPKSLAHRRLLTRAAHRYIVVSSFMREQMRAHGIDVSLMQVLYNPIDTQRFAALGEARARMRAALGVSPDTLLIGYVGRMTRIKGIFTLLAAAEKLFPAAPQARLLWVGEGVDLAPLRAQVAQSRWTERHLFRGWTDNMPAIYNALDVLAVPSEYPEPFGRVSVEAQACAVPVVCSDAGGLPETFAPGMSGLLVPRGDAQALAEALLAISCDPARRRALGQAGRQLACASFSLEEIALSFEAVLADRQYIHRLPSADAALISSGSAAFADS